MSVGTFYIDKRKSNLQVTGSGFEQRKALPPEFIMGTMCGGSSGLASLGLACEYNREARGTLNVLWGTIGTSYQCLINAVFVRFPVLETLDLLGDDLRVVFRDLFSLHGLVVERAVVGTVVAVLGAEESAASALETGEANALLALVASVGLFQGRGGRSVAGAIYSGVQAGARTRSRKTSRRIVRDDSHIVLQQSLIGPDGRSGSIADGLLLSCRNHLSHSGSNG